VDGVVTTKGGQPGSAQIVIFPADAAKWVFPSRFIRRATTDATGRFELAGLPAFDRYLAVAADYVEEGEHFDPEFLARMTTQAVAFALTEAGTRSLELPLIER
jgi:hypothetical protein